MSYTDLDQDYGRMITRRAMLRMSALGIGLVGLGGAAAGCSSSAGQGSGKGEEAKLTTIRSDAVSWIWAPYLVAEANGFFTKHGLDDQGIVSNRGEVAQIVSSGQRDSIIGAPAGPMKTTLAGQPLTIFCGLVSTYASNIVVSKAAYDKAGLSESSSISDRANAMRGLTMASTGPGAGPDLLLRYVAGKVGNLNPDRDMKIVAVQSGGAATLAALRSGQVNGFCLSSPTSDQAIASLGARYLFNMAENPIPALKDYPYIVASTRPGFIQDKRDQLESFSSALQEALNYIKKDQDGFKETMRKLFKGVDPKTFQIGFEATKSIYPDTVELTQSQYAQAQQFLGLALKEVGKSQSAADKLTFDKMVDTSIAKMAVKKVGTT